FKKAAPGRLPKRFGRRFPPSRLSRALSRAVLLPFAAFQKRSAPKLPWQGKSVNGTRTDLSGTRTDHPVTCPTYLHVQVKSLRREQLRLLRTGHARRSAGWSAHNHFVVCELLKR